MKVKKRLICFDLDHTLISSNKAVVIALKKSLKKHGYGFITNNQIYEKLGIPTKIFLKELIPDITKKELKSVHELKIKYLRVTGKKYVHKIKGSLNALKELKKNYKIAIVTNSSKKKANILLSSARLDKRLFDVIVDSDNINPKPSPDEIIKAEQLLKLKADFMVGDSTYDIIAARNAKVRCIAVTTGNHSKAKLIKERPYAIIKSVKDLPKFLKSNHLLS